MEKMTMNRSDILTWLVDVHYLPCTNTKPARWAAVNQNSGRRVISSAWHNDKRVTIEDAGLAEEHAARAAAIAKLVDVMQKDAKAHGCNTADHIHAEYLGTSRNGYLYRVSQIYQKA